IAMDEVRKKLFSISLSGKAAHWYKLLDDGDSLEWNDIVPRFYSKFYHPSEIHKDRNRIYNFWPHDGESISQAWGRLKSLMLKCPIHELPGNIIIDNFYARLSFQDKTLLDTSCSGSFTRNKEEFKRDLLNRIQENTEGWENDKDRESDCKKEKILTKFAGESYEFHFSKFAKTPYKADSPNNDFRVEQCASIALAPNNPLQLHLENSESEVFREERNELDEIFLHQPILKHDLPVEDLGITLPPKEDLVFDLKPLPDDLKYAHIDDKKIYPVIISSKLSEIEEERLLEILKKHRGAIGYTLDDLKGISPSICQHAINMEDDAKPVVEHQRRLIPKMKDVVRNEVLKLLEAGIIYPIADSRWVSPVHCFPKKGGMTVVPNDNDELIPQRVVVGLENIAYDPVPVNDSFPNEQLAVIKVSSRDSPWICFQSRSTMVSDNKGKGLSDEDIQDPEWKEVDESVKEEDEEEVEEDSRAHPRATIASIRVVENPFSAKRSARIRTGGKVPRHYLAPKTSSPGTYNPFRNLIYNSQIERTPKAALPSNWDIDRSNTAGRMKPEAEEWGNNSKSWDSPSDILLNRVEHNSEMIHNLMYKIDELQELVEKLVKNSSPPPRSNSSSVLASPWFVPSLGSAAVSHHHYLLLFTIK
ncbi:hypothetical protein QYE76_019216, partial [Lolium multiflorum]